MVVCRKRVSVEEKTGIEEETVLALKTALGFSPLCYPSLRLFSAVLPGGL